MTSTLHQNARFLTPGLFIWGLLELLAVGCSHSSTKLPPAVDCSGCSVFRAARIFDGLEVHANAQLLIADGKVRQILDGSVEVAGANIVRELGDVTVIPGLIDMHVHLLGTGAPYVYQPSTAHDHDNLKALLRSGVTTALDLGNRRSVMVEYRRRIQAGSLFGPRLLIAGSFVTPPGGHPCYDGMAPRDHCILIDDPSRVEAALAPLLEMKPDVIKIVVESGAVAAPLPRMTADVEAGIAGVAQANGLKVFAHLTHAEEVAQSLASGVSGFAHLVSRDRLSAAVIDQMRTANAVVIPTLVAWDTTQQISHENFGWLDDAQLRKSVPAEVIAAVKSRELQPKYLFAPAYRAFIDGEVENQKANFQALVKAGVTIAAGTDCGVPNDFCGVSMARELELYVQYGMSPKQAITAATHSAATALGRNDLGRLQPGALADFVVVLGDLLSDISRLREVRAVYLGGSEVDRDALEVGRGTSLVRTAEPVHALGTPCTLDADCGASAVCLRYERVCSARCTSSAQCPKGSACGPTAAGLSACHPGDACDPLAQSCPNGTGCYLMGNAATICASPGSKKPGQSCQGFVDCAPGSQCDTSAGMCRQFCAPSQTPSACTTGQTCVDLSSAAGVSAGWCAP